MNTPRHVTSQRRGTGGVALAHSTRGTQACAAILSGNLAATEPLIYTPIHPHRCLSLSWRRSPAACHRQARITLTQIRFCRSMGRERVSRVLRRILLDSRAYVAGIMLVWISAVCHKRRGCQMSFEQGPFLIVAAFCEQVIEDKSGVISLIRIVDRLTVDVRGSNVPEDMPVQTLNWTLFISLKSGEVGGSYPIRIEPVLPSGETRRSFTMSAHLGGGNLGQNIFSRIVMPLPMPGVYWFRIYFDEELLTQVPIEVIYSRIVTSGPTDPAPGQT